MNNVAKSLALVCTIGLLAIGCSKDPADNNEKNNASNGSNNNSNNSSQNGDPNNVDPNNNVPGGQYCQINCSVAADCGVGDWACNNSRCVYTGDLPDVSCSGNEECVARYSAWMTECQDDAGCPGQVCINTGDAAAGRCAISPSEFFACATASMSEFETTKFEDDSEVTVCANTDAECRDDVCIVPCTTDSCAAAGLVCDTTTGNCHCVTDAHWTQEGSDKCYNGVCGCSGQAACDAIPGATNFVCDSF